MRVCLLALLSALLLGGEGSPTIFVFRDTIAGKPSPTTDRKLIEDIVALHRERLARARAELPGAIPAIARQIRADIGSLEAELERLAVAGGGTLTVGKRVYTVQPGRITVEEYGTRLEIDPATGKGRSLSGAGSEPQPIEMASPPTALPVERGVPGPPVLGRATLRFAFSVERRDYVVLVDPTLPNPLAHLVAREGEAVPLMAELARLPGMPLDISTDSGDVVRRTTCVEMK